jgi:hypothetical protein
MPIHLIHKNSYVKNYIVKLSYRVKFFNPLLNLNFDKKKSYESFHCTTPTDYQAKRGKR